MSPRELARKHQLEDDKHFAIVMFACAVIFASGFVCGWVALS